MATWLLIQYHNKEKRIELNYDDDHHHYRHHHHHRRRLHLCKELT
jgi:hypothetical protein